MVFLRQTCPGQLTPMGWLHVTVQLLAAWPPPPCISLPSTPLPRRYTEVIFLMDIYFFTSVSTHIAWIPPQGLMYARVTRTVPRGGSIGAPVSVGSEAPDGKLLSESAAQVLKDAILSHGGGLPPPQAGSSPPASFPWDSIVATRARGQSPGPGRCQWPTKLSCC